MNKEQAETLDKILDKLNSLSTNVSSAVKPAPSDILVMYIDEGGVWSINENFFKKTSNGNDFLVKKSGKYDIKILCNSFHANTNRIIWISVNGKSVVGQTYSGDCPVFTLDLKEDDILTPSYWHISSGNNIIIMITAAKEN